MTADTPDPRSDSLFPPLPEVPQEAYEERLRDWPDPRPVSPPSHPDDGHDHWYACIRCGVDNGINERAAPQADAGLREALNLVGECRVQGPHPHAFVGPHRFNEAGSRDVLDEIEDLVSHPDGRTPKQLIEAIRKKARAASQPSEDER